MKSTVYIETTVPSYYFDQRLELRSAIDRTREWWDKERGEYENFLSVAVIEELDRGDYSSRRKCLELVANIPLIEVTSEVLEIAQMYRAEKLMPGPPSADAVHVALASVFQMDFLLTWNCRHLANVRKMDHLDVVNRRHGLAVPRLVTPEQLRLREDDI